MFIQEKRLKFINLGKVVDFTFENYVKEIHPKFKFDIFSNSTNLRET